MPVWVIVLIVVIVAIVVLLSLGYFLAEESFCGVASLVGIIGFVATFFCGLAERSYETIIYDNIYSVRGTYDEIDGFFFLGTGTIDEDTYYVVFVEDERGYKLQKFDAIRTYIVEVDDGNYYVEHVKEKWTLSDYYVLYVPVGTIIVEYRI